MSYFMRDWKDRRGPHEIAFSEGGLWALIVGMILIGLILGASFGILVTP